LATGQGLLIAGNAAGISRPYAFLCFGHLLVAGIQVLADGGDMVGLDVAGIFLPKGWFDRRLGRCR